MRSNPIAVCRLALREPWTRPTLGLISLAIVKITTVTARRISFGGDEEVQQQRIAQESRDRAF